MHNWAEMTGYPLTEAQCAQFETYYQLLAETNKVMNLTAITEANEVARLHFADSLAGAACLPQGASLLDMGSGAGFPGLPLAIFRPDLKVTLMDSLNKRVLFLQQVIAALGLTNVEAVHSRAEDGRAYFGQFDVCTARAVAALNVLSEYTLPYLKVGGLFLAYKGPQAEEEADQAKRALQILGGSVESIRNVTLPGCEHKLILVRKTAPTPKKYPRKAGTPAKSPL